MLVACTITDTASSHPDITLFTLSKRWLCFASVILTTT